MDYIILSQIKINNGICYVKDMNRFFVADYFTKCDISTCNLLQEGGSFFL